MVLSGKIALVIGAGQGLGRAVARAYAREGATVIAADFNAAAATETIASLSRPADASAERVDVSDAADTRRVIRRIVDRYGRLDVMVNCAAILLVDPILEVTPQRWDQVFAVNARGAFFAMQAA